MNLWRSAGPLAGSGNSRGLMNTGERVMDFSTPECREGQDALLRTLECLFAIEATDLKTALREAANRVAESLAAEKVDAFLYDPAIDSLVAVGVSDTPLGQQEQALGLDRLPLTNGRRAVQVFQSGTSYRSGQVDQDPEELRGIIHGLG